ncbi:hypothetical protein NX774_22250 [Massilia agilis]|uniref:DUF2846 domain-containing protein n=1 Tax=Massilia agilis TaxID=1811226 RepID=A0ABT2DHM3_9BURK|nr:hypothetical protein [Massilia agilis]MCS0810653.1 hypothetical protein [Massilia agilis]
MRNTLRCPASGVLKCLITAAAALLLHGCITIQPVTPRAEIPRADRGYVAGVFVPTLEEFGLGITNMNGGEETVLPFTDPSQKFQLGERLTMIQLPPGRYRISSWLTYNSFYKEKSTRKELPQSEKLQFTVTPGRVAYLGKFSASKSFSGFTIHFKIKPLAITLQDLTLLAETYYPNFGIALYDPQPGSLY